MLFTSHAMKENILVFCDSEIILRPHTIKVLRKGALAFPTAENCTLACFVFLKSMIVVLYVHVISLLWNTSLSD